MTPRLHHSVTHLLALLCVLCASVVQTHAQTAVPDRFRQLDKDGSGTLTRNEVTDAAAFTAADADKDGVVTVAEYRRYVANRPKAPKPAPARPAPTAATPSAPPPVDGKPLLKQLPGCDAVRDAAGTGQLFECVHVPGITATKAAARSTHILGSAKRRARM